MSKLRLAIVIGSIRPNRFGGHAAQWIEEVARRRGDFEVFAFVGYGGVGGARAVEQLRLHAIELQMAPIRTAVHILFPDYLAVIKDGKPLSELEHLNQAARQMLDQLAWWTSALKAAREKSLRQAA